MERPQRYDTQDSFSPARVRAARAVGVLVAAALVLGLGLRAGITRGAVTAARERLRGQRPRTVLRVWDWWSPSVTEAFARYFGAIETEFERQHPDVDLQFQFVPFGQYEQKMATALVGNS